MKTFDFMRSTKFDLVSQIGVNSINVILSKISAYTTRAPKRKKKIPGYATVHDNETETTAAAAVAYFSLKGQKKIRQTRVSAATFRDEI